MRFPISSPTFSLAALAGLFFSVFSTAQAGPTSRPIVRPATTFAAKSFSDPAYPSVSDAPETAAPAATTPSAPKVASVPGTVVQAPPASIPPEKLAQLSAPDRNTYKLVVSVAEQKIALVRNGEIVRKYPVSTSRFGVGDSYGSYRTPLGQLKVCEKLGGGMPEGTVFKGRVPTGEILTPNSKGRDPIVTRILWLDGQEAINDNARERGIYIHGTPVEKMIGKPASYGCIRMRSRDVVELYNAVPVGTAVTITKDRLQSSSIFSGGPLAEYRRSSSYSGAN